jgi:hypothetical protein
MRFQVLPYPTEDAPGVPLGQRWLLHQCQVCQSRPHEPLVVLKFSDRDNLICQSCLKNALHEINQLEFLVRVRAIARDK